MNNHHELNLQYAKPYKLQLLHSIYVNEPEYFKTEDKMKDFNNDDESSLKHLTGFFCQGYDDHKVYFILETEDLLISRVTKSI